METLKDILWPIVLVGGLGGLIDFLIGKAGQGKAKDFLLKWWVRFDDVRWKNFGREEGLFAGQIIERWFGKRIWSWRRILLAFVLLDLFFVLGVLTHTGAVVESILRSYNITGFAESDYVLCFLCRSKLYVGIITLLIFIIGFSLSISFTKFIAFHIAYLCGEGWVKNLIAFLVMLLLNYLMLVFWFPLTDAMKGIFMLVLTVAPKINMTNFGSLLYSSALLEYENLKFGMTYPKVIVEFLTSKIPIDGFALFCLSLFPSMCRFILSIVFVGSFLLRPFVMRPVSLIWARIVESDKPVFTLILGGAAAFATAVSEAAKHL